MTFKIGSKYEETKARLRQGILEKNIKIAEPFPKIIEKTGAQCYFCKKHIIEKNDVIILIDFHQTGFYLYPIDVQCFRQAQINFYMGDIPFSVN